MTELNPNNDFDIDINNLDEEFRKLPRYLAAYSQQYSDAVAEHSTCKQQVIEIKSIIVLDLVAAEEKRPTEKILDCKVAIHPAYKNAVAALVKAERDVNTLKGGSIALSAKKDMLIQIGANARKEL